MLISNNKSKMKKLVLFILIITSFTAYAQKSGFYSFRTSADRFGAQNPVLFGQMLAQHHNLNESAISDLLNRFNLNWGDLAVGLEMVNLSKKPVNMVLVAYEKNQGWGNIAKDLGIKPGSAEFHRMKRNLSQSDKEWSKEWNTKVSKSGKNNKMMPGNSSSKSKGKK
jgi:hypothetical protein